MTELKPTKLTAVEDAEEEEPILMAKLPKKKNKIVCRLLIALFVISFMICLSVLIWYFIGVESEEESKSNALYEIDGIKKYINNFTETDYNTFDHAFQAFDTNDDGSLNMEEFRNFFETQLDNTSIFERMDIDTDGILSYGECVAYIKYGIGTSDSFMHNMAPLINETYDYDYYSDSSITALDLFFEYAAIMLYFERFDADSNGYIHKTEWLSISSHNEFAVNDFDNDGQITEDEFLNILYGTNERSWKGHFDQSVGGDKYDSITVTKEMVSELQVELNLCPNQVQAAHKRRLFEIDIGGVLFCWEWVCGAGLFAGYPCYQCYELLWVKVQPCYVLPAGTTVWFMDDPWACP